MAHDEHEPTPTAHGAGLWARYRHKSSALRRARVYAAQYGRAYYVCADYLCHGADTHDGRPGPSWVLTAGGPFYPGSRWVTVHPHGPTTTTTTTTTTMGG